MSSIQHFHNLIVKYGLCKSEDKYLALRIFSLLFRAVVMNKYQYSNLSPVKLNDDEENDLSYDNINSPSAIHDTIENTTPETIKQDLVFKAMDNPELSKNISEEYQKQVQELKIKKAVSKYFVMRDNICELIRIYIDDDEKMKTDKNKKELYSQVLGKLVSIDPRNFYKIYKCVENIIDNEDKDMKGIYSQFTEHYADKNKKEGNSTFTPQNVATLMADIGLKYVKYIRGNSIYLNDDDLHNRYSTYYDKEGAHRIELGIEHEDTEKMKELLNTCNYTDFNRGISVIDPGSGENALSNAVLDECQKYNIKINHLRAYEYDDILADIGELMMLRKLNQLHKKGYDVVISTRNINEQDRNKTDINDMRDLLYRNAQTTAAKAECEDYIEIENEKLRTYYNHDNPNDFIDLTISNPPYTNLGNLKEPVVRFLNKAVSNSKVSVFIIPKNMIFNDFKYGNRDKKTGEIKGEEKRADIIAEILNQAELVEIIDLGDQKKVFSGKGVSDSVIAVFVRKEFIKNELIVHPLRKIQIDIPKQKYILRIGYSYKKYYDKLIEIPESHEIKEIGILDEYYYLDDELKREKDDLENRLKLEDVMKLNLNKDNILEYTDIIKNGINNKYGLNIEELDIKIKSIGEQLKEDISNQFMIDEQDEAFELDPDMIYKSKSVRIQKFVRYVNLNENVQNVQNVQNQQYYLSETSNIKETKYKCNYSKYYKYFNFRDYPKYVESVVRADLKKWKGEGQKIHNKIVNNEILAKEIDKLSLKTRKADEFGFELIKKAKGEIIEKTLKNTIEELKLQLIRRIYNSIKNYYLIGEMNDEILKEREGYIEKIKTMKDEEIIDLAFKYDYKNEYSLLKSKNLQLCKYKFGDVFEKVKMMGSFKVNEAKQKDSIYKYPLYTSSNQKIIQGYVNKPSYINTTNDKLIFCTLFGYIGIIYDNEFSIQGNGNIFILKLNSNLINIDLNINSKLITLQLTKLIDGYMMLTYDKVKDVDIYLYA